MIGWFEVGESKVLGPYLVNSVISNVQLTKQRLLSTESRQKAYANKRDWELEFLVGDLFFYVYQ